MPQKNLNALTGLRWIAAFYVFIYHIHLRVPLSVFPIWVQEIISQGAIGVNLFFILSGFILTYGYYKKSDTIDFWGFMKKRIIRIYPAYVTGWALCVLVTTWFQLFPEHFTLIAFLNLFALNSYFPKYSMQWFGGGSWSISNEFFFYMLFPFLIPALNRLSKRVLYIFGFAVIIVSITPGLICNLYPNSLSIAFVYSSPVCRVEEFIIGIVSALLVFKFNLRVKEWVPAILLLLAGGYFALLGYQLKGITVNNFIVIPAFATLIMALARNNNSYLNKWLSSKPMVYLGKISYCFYIVQLPVFILFESLFDKGILSRFLINTPLIFLACFGLAVLLYHFIERPVHRYFETNRTKRASNYKVRPVEQ